MEYLDLQNAPLALDEEALKRGIEFLRKLNISSPKKKDVRLNLFQRFLLSDKGTK